MKELVDRVVDLEWEFFQNVNNEGGRASCQDNRRTFDIMRKSQFKAWDADTLESYLSDLLAAKSAGENPLREKYARMMESTDAAEYKKLEAKLPPVVAGKKQLVDDIVAIQMPWQRDYARAYSRLATRARPVGSMSDRQYTTSVETYLRGELLTYSEETLRRYLRHIRSVFEAGGNLTVAIMENTVKMYGYQSLQAAEDAIAASAEL